jgi:hypothetical protein
MLVFSGKKFELLPAAPDLYGRVYYFVSNGEVMSPKAYPKMVAEMVCAAWNGDDSKFYEIAEGYAGLERTVEKYSKLDTLISQDNQRLTERNAELEKALEAIVDAASIVDYEESRTKLQLLELGKFARAKARTALKKGE